MPEDKVYLIIKVKSDEAHDFNVFWVKESLPYWIKHGARHIGSFINWSGPENNEIMRLFEFENIATLEKWQKFLHDSKEGKELLVRLSKFHHTVESKLLRTAPTV